MRQLIKEFREFLKEYKVLGLAIGFVMATAATALVKSLVDNIVMPLVTPFIPGGAWEKAAWHLGPVVIGWGAFLSALINFFIMAWVVFLVAKIVLKEAKVEQK